MRKKIYNISLIATSIFVYFAWKMVEQIDLSVINSVVVQRAIKMIIDFILAYGFFHICANIIIGLSNKITFIKRIILGSSYIEGVWVGYYYLESDQKQNAPKLIYFIEQMEQTLDDIIITGEALYEDKSFRCSWKSGETARIDMRNRSLVYVYSADFGNAKIPSNIGIAYYHLYNKGHSTPPDRISGYSANIGNVRKEVTMAIKADNLPYKLNREQLLERAIEFHKSEKTKKSEE